MKSSTLPFPFAKAIDVLNQVLFLIILASFTNGKLGNADLHNIASQFEVTHYDCGDDREQTLRPERSLKKQYCSWEPRNQYNIFDKKST